MLRRFASYDIRDKRDDGEPDFEFIGLPQAADPPAVQWNVIALANALLKTLRTTLSSAS